MDKPIDFNAPALYRIELQERMGSDWNEWFDGFTVAHAVNGGILMTGTVADQAALHGIIRKVRDLGLTLVAVQRMGTHPEEPEMED